MNIWELEERLENARYIAKLKHNFVSTCHDNLALAKRHLDEAMRRMLELEKQVDAARAARAGRGAAA